VTAPRRPHHRNPKGRQESWSVSSESRCRPVSPLDGSGIDSSSSLGCAPQALIERTVAISQHPRNLSEASWTPRTWTPEGPGWRERLDALGSRGRSVILEVFRHRIGAGIGPKRTRSTSLTLSPLVVAKRRRCLEIQGLRRRAPQAYPWVRRGCPTEHNAVDSGTYGVAVDDR
jgi:hypothetical protein